MYLKLIPQLSGIKGFCDNFKLELTEKPVQLIGQPLSLSIKLIESEVIEWRGSSWGTVLIKFFFLFRNVWTVGLFVVEIENCCQSVKSAYSKKVDAEIWNLLGLAYFPRGASYLRVPRGAPPRSRWWTRPGRARSAPRPSSKPARPGPAGGSDRSCYASARKAASTARSADTPAAPPASWCYLSEYMILYCYVFTFNTLQIYLIYKITTGIKYFIIVVIVLSTPIKGWKDRLSCRSPPFSSARVGVSMAIFIPWGRQEIPFNSPRWEMTCSLKMACTPAYMFSPCCVWCFIL